VKSPLPLLIGATLAWSCVAPSGPVSPPAVGAHSASVALAPHAVPPAVPSAASASVPAPPPFPVASATASIAAPSSIGEGHVPPGNEVAEDPDPWCPLEAETLAGPICAFVPEELPEGDRTLVVFLHGVTNVGSGWQLATIRGMVRYAKQYGFGLIAPRGVRRAASEGKDEAYAWPNAALSQQHTEGAVLQSWEAARTTLETRAGKKFDRVLVVGFSSGAYYASSLALRGKRAADGYAVFAGGAAPYSKGMIAAVEQRAPIFIGYGLKDKAAVKDARKLAAALRAARWKHREVSVPKVGHTITTSEFRDAIAWLRANTPVTTFSSDKRAGKEPSPTTRPKRKRRNGSH